MLSQFTREVPEHRTLADLFDFPPQVYPVGRLDRDSEGLLLLTDDRRFNDRLLNPRHGHQRTYWVQVEGAPSASDLGELAAGPMIRIKGKGYQSRPLQVERITPEISPRNPPIRVRKNIPETWLSLTMTEGKNRQVRRMCAAIGYPVLRLVRYSIDGVSLDDLAGSEVLEVSQAWLRARLELP